MLFPGGDVAQAQFMRRRFCITCLERGRRMECMKLSRWMLARLPLPIREIERPNSHFNGLGALRPGGGANAVAGCWPTPEEHIPSGSDRVRVGLFTSAN